MDGATEKRALLAGADANNGTVHAIDPGQGGDGVQYITTTTANFTQGSGPRAIIPVNLGANIILTLALTGGVAGQHFYVDMYATAHTVTVKFGSTTIGPSGAALAAQAAGSATRYDFQITNDGLSIVYIGATSLSVNA